MFSQQHTMSNVDKIYSVKVKASILYTFSTINYPGIMKLLDQTAKSKKNISRVLPFPHHYICKDTCTLIKFNMSQCWEHILMCPWAPQPPQYKIMYQPQQKHLVLREHQYFRLQTCVGTEVTKTVIYKKMWKWSNTKHMRFEETISK